MVVQNIEEKYFYEFAKNIRVDGQKVIFCDLKENANCQVWGSGLRGLGKPWNNNIDNTIYYQYIAINKLLLEKNIDNKLLLEKIIDNKL